MKVSIEGALRPDPWLKGVMRLLEPDGPKRLVRDLAACLATGSGPGVDRPGETARILIVKQRDRQRVVLRVRKGDDASGWYVKLVRKRAEMRMPIDPDRARAAADRAGVTIPLPVGVLPRFRAIVSPEIPGAPLTRVDATMAGALGTALAHLHAELPLPEPRRGRPFEETQVARARERGLIRYRPDLRARHDAAVDRWRSVGSVLPPERDGDLVACHGDLHTAQVLATHAGGRLGLVLLDWDMHCAAEAERDAGNLLTDLVLLEALGLVEVADGTRREIQRAFVRAYQSVRGLDAQRLDWYATGSLLRLAALYSDPGFGRSGPARAGVAERLLIVLESGSHGHA